MANAFWLEPTPMDVDYDPPQPQHVREAQVESKARYPTCKRAIPKKLKIDVWNYYVSEEIGKTKCMCCQSSEIIQGHFEAGHVISERDGGPTNIENLRPVCSLCNKSMGARNMLDFMRECGYRKPHNWNGRLKGKDVRMKEVIIIE
jgi:hypothetical protein